MMLWVNCMSRYRKLVILKTSNYVKNLAGVSIFKVKKTFCLSVCLWGE